MPKALTDFWVPLARSIGVWHVFLIFRDHVTVAICIVQRGSVAEIKAVQGDEKGGLRVKFRPPALALRAVPSMLRAS
jgi:hypothetical protein